MDLSEEKHFREKDLQGSEDYETTSSENSDYNEPRPKSNGYSKVIFTVFFHVIALFVLSIATLFATHTGTLDRDSKIPKASSPAELASGFQLQTVDNTLRQGNRFIGEPSADVDEAWDSILQYKNLALDPSTIDDTEAVEINDSSGRVLANLDVFYNLHCLNFVRKYIFRTEYSLKFPENGLQAQKGYVTHCIDAIRQSLVCHADVALHTYTWEDFQLVPYPDFKVDHECRNWDSVVEWAKLHAAPDLSGSILTHPVYGPSFPDL